MMRDAQSLLIGALRQRIDPPPVIRCAHCEGWSSATFVGQRHRITFATLSAERAAALVDGIEEVEFHLPGHLVADISVASREVSEAGTLIVIAALTVEDA